MFGSAAISEFPIASQSILLFESASIDANFTQTTPAVKIANGVMNVQGTSSKASIGVGVLAGIVDGSFNFTEAADLTRFATGVSAQVIKFDQSSDANITAITGSGQSFDFTQDSTGLTIKTGISEASANFISEADAVAIYSAASTSSAEFVQDVLGGIITSGISEQSMQFDSFQVGGFLIQNSIIGLEFGFVQTTDGDFLWVRIDADTPSETWTGISHSGDTWTEINASGIVNTWNEKVVQMAYTVNNGIEKPDTGTQSGTWGDTVNENMDILDRVLGGVGEISLSGTTHTLTTTDGAVSDGHYKVLVLNGSLTATNTVTISPNDQEKLYFVYNNAGDTVTFTQGSGGNVSIADGAQAIIYSDGAGSGAKVSQISPTPAASSITASMANKDVQTKTATASVTLSADAIITYVKHSGTGTLSIGQGQYDGQTINITSTGTMTLSWHTGSQGISLGSAATLASGVWDATAGYWFFSETVTS